MIKPSQFRKDIYNLLDQVILTGKPLEIERKGKILKISLERTSMTKLKNLKKRKIMSENPESYVHSDWSKEWTPEDIV